MNRWTPLLTTILIGLFAGLGCSGGGNPAIPDSESSLTAVAGPHATQAHTVLWGYWDVYIDIENQTIEAIPVRDAMFTANLVGILNNIPAGLSFTFNGTDVGVGYVDVDLDVRVTHPIPAKPQFNGYDVRGVFMGDGSMTMIYNGDLVYPVPGTDQMMLADPDDGFGGPDGYTRWFNFTEFSLGGMPLFSYTPGKFAAKGYGGTATLCPYKYFADGLAATGNLWSWLGNNPGAHGVFSSGSTNTRNYYVRFPVPLPGIKYGYAVIANWGGGAPEFHPSNAPEAVGCDVIDDSNVWYQDPVNNGGELKLDISLFDWGGQPSAIFIESTVLTNAYQLNPTEMTPVGGGENYSTYRVEIPADNITTVAGNEFWLIAQFDAYDYTNAFGVPNLADTDLLAAFFRYDLEVGTEPVCPTPEVLGIFPAVGNPDTVVTGAVINVTDLEDGPSLAASLVTFGEPDIVGTNVTYVDVSSLTADFDLTGAALNFWDVEVTNGCGGTPGLGDNLFQITDCLPPEGCIMDPACASTGDVIEDATITCTGFVDGPCLAVSLKMPGQLNLPGTDVTFVDDTTITVDFNLFAAKTGAWDVVITNGCCSPPAVIAGGLLVTADPTKLTALASGPLLDPLPFPDDKQFCVVGSDEGGHQGVFYFGDNYDIMFYPLDYSSPGELYMTMEGMTDPLPIPAPTFFGEPEELGAIEVDSSGGVAITSHSTGILWSVYERNMCAIWFEADTPEVSNAVVLDAAYGTTRSKDVEASMQYQGMIWTLFGIENIVTPPIEVTHCGNDYPYQNGNYAGWGTNWAPLDEVGSVDGEVSDLEAYKLAVDSDPVGLTGDLDVIFYYLEGAPDDPGIEVFANTVATGGTDQTLLATIDTTDLIGTPVDISVVHSAGYVGCDSTNWLCVLEDNGDSTWQVAVFDQTGALIVRLDMSMPGTPLGLDCDTESQRIHVWADNASILEYTILHWL